MILHFIDEAILFDVSIRLGGICIRKQVRRDFMSTKIVTTHLLIRNKVGKPLEADVAFILLK